MPNIYPQGLLVPELNGMASGGVSIVFHQPEELELLYALSSLAPRPPAAPLKSLAAALSDPRLDLIAWHREWASNGTNFMPLSASEPDPERGKKNSDTDDDPSDLSALRNVLVVLKTLWGADPADVPLLSCVVTIESDTDAGEKGVSWDTRTANLAFGRGSLDVWLGRGPRRAMRFLAGLVLGGGIDSTARASHLVKRARDRALAARGTAAVPLRPLSELKLPDVAGKLVVLIHGLCSTDVGTFGDFETHLSSLKGVTVAGFPHDSLTTPIRLNAHALAQQIVKLGKPEVRLVCHSRGGLVARQTYVYLKEQPPPGSTRWLHSCVTFGTPHLGTSVASSPVTLTGVIMAAAHVRRSPGAPSLVDVLCGSDGNGFVGVNELLPSAVEGSYLSKLEGQEKRLFLDDGFALTAFGSVINPSSIWDRIGSSVVGRLLGTADHDILVPTSSSIPTLRAAPTQPLSDRSHFEYFTRPPNDSAVPQHFALAVAGMELGVADTAHA
jgi:hypothetical protein